jgi:hypothetical protein
MFHFHLLQIFDLPFGLYSCQVISAKAEITRSDKG